MPLPGLYLAGSAYRHFLQKGHGPLLSERGFRSFKFELHSFRLIILDNGIKRRVPVRFSELRRVGKWHTPRRSSNLPAVGRKTTVRVYVSSTSVPAPGSWKTNLNSLQSFGTLLGSFAVMFCSVGFVNAFGVFQAYYEEGFLADKSPSTISWLGSFNIFIMFGMTFPVGYLSDKYGPRV